MRLPSRRPGVILPAVLFILVLVGLLGAMFAFRVNADLAATQARACQVQCRLAAEAGVERVKLLLRTSRLEMDRWFHNPDELHRVLVWSPEADSSRWGTTEELGDAVTAYRFSIVADDPLDDEEYIRIGITDESAKLNLNEATEAQLLMLVRAAVSGDESIDPQAIVDAILDWRDNDATPHGEAADTEGPYYESLDPPYRVKNGPFSTVEELLLVKGVSGQVLYGEDWDRNGLLSPNEDDGPESFPPDNADGVLNRGLYPYLTVLSYEDNVSNDRRPRIYLLGDENVVREQLAELFTDEAIISYIINVTRAQGPGTGPGTGDSQGGANTESGSNPSGPNPPGGPAPNTGNTPAPGGDKSESRQQRRQRPPEDEQPPSDTPTDEAPPSDEPPPADEGDEVADSPEAGAEPEPEPESDDASPPAGPIQTPASLLLARTIGGEVRESPIGTEHLAVLLDRTTTVPPEQRQLKGLINVNTAPRLVLETIEALSDTQIDAIVSVRDALDAATKATPAWLVTQDIVDLETLEKIAPKITARGQQFTIEALGYADHIGMVTRLQVVVDMIGPVAQTVYYRDLSGLGGNFPIRERDAERLRAR